MGEIIFWIIIALLYGWVIRDYFTNKTTHHNRECTCGRYEICKSQDIIEDLGPNGFRMSHSDFLSCGKVQDQIEKLKKIPIKNRK